MKGHPINRDNKLLNWFPRPQLTNRAGFGQPLRKIHHPYNIVFIKVKLQLLEFTKKFKCPFIPAKVIAVEI